MGFLIFGLFASTVFFVSHPRPAVTLPPRPNITPQAHVSINRPSELSRTDRQTESQKGGGGLPLKPVSICRVSGERIGQRPEGKTLIHSW